MASKFSIRWRDNVWSSHHSTSVELEVEVEQVQELLGQQQSLENSLRDLATTVTGTPAAEQVSQSLQKARTSTALLRTHLDKLWALVPPAMRPADGMAAQKLFDTPELLEEVLTYLQPREVLQVMRVQRPWYETVMGSIKLKRYLGLELPCNPFYYSAFSHRFHQFTTRESMIKGPQRIDDEDPMRFDFEINSEASSTWNPHENVTYDIKELRIESEFTLSSIESVKMGSRVQAMHFCSPPAQTLHGLLECDRCCIYDQHFRQALAMSTKDEQGFSIGDLYDLALQALTRHKACDINSFHFTHRPRISIGTSIQMHNDDPIFVERRERKARAEREKEERAAERTRVWLEEEQRRLEREAVVFIRDDDGSQNFDDDESSFYESDSGSDDEDSEDEDDVYADEQDEEWDEAEQFFGGEMGDPYAEQLEVE